MFILIFTGSSELGAPPLTVSVKLLYGINTITVAICYLLHFQWTHPYLTVPILFTYGLTDHTKSRYCFIPYADDITLIVSHKFNLFQTTYPRPLKISWAMNSENSVPHIPYLTLSSTPATTSVVFAFLAFLPWM